VVALIVSALCPTAQSFENTVLSGKCCVHRPCVAYRNQERRTEGFGFGVEILLSQKRYDVGNPKHLETFLTNTCENMTQLQSDGGGNIP
jgi:hypothetical protein